MNIRLRRPLVMAAGLSLLVAACVSGALAAPAHQSAALVQVANNPTLGTILVNSQGMTLYTLSTEADGTIHCTGACLTAWPPLLLPAGATAPTIGPGVVGNVGTIARPDGTKQVTYNGVPVYTFIGDKAAGDITGQGVVAFGGTWFVVKVTAAPSATATPSSTTTTPSTTPTVQVSNNATLGNILVSPEGLTLYYNTAEHGTTIVCAGACLAHWPPILLPAGVATPTAGAGVTGTLSSITRPDGGQQVTYNNEPLYTFAGDKKPGDTTGEGIVAFGGVWHAARVNSIPLSAIATVPLTVRVTTAGSKVWGKVSVHYTFAGHRFQQACASSKCMLSVPVGIALHFKQTPANATTWPFKEWKVTSIGAHASRSLMGKTATLKLAQGGRITAVYALHR
jgi:predicted lipoprotein with Yx(FWY)xxD motif